MAKKIIVSFPKKAVESLKKHKVEHVCVTYHRENGKPDDVFLVVLNKDFNDAKAVIKADGGSILKTKSIRNYEMLALKHEHYQPQFDCKCRHCGKTFKSPVKEAVWCSKECKKEFRALKKSKNSEE